MNTDANAAMNELAATLYTELRQLARSARRQGGATLDTTALVHEAYLKLCTGDTPRFVDRRQFFAYAGRTMRNILIDSARARARLKAGGDQIRVTVTDTGLEGLDVDPLQALALDAALTELAAEDERAARVVELHYFAGLTLGQVADVIGVVRRTVDRDWRYARAFLLARVV